MSLDVNKMTKDQLRQHILMLAMQLTQLEEENKKLNEDYKVLWILNDEIRRINENLREENKKLKAELDATVESKNFYIKKLIEERDYFKKQLYGFTHLDEHK